MLEISKSTNNIGSTFSSANPEIYNRFKKDQDGEVFERVVFDLMLNKYSDDADLSDYILSLPNDKQRMALLSLIDGDTALWSKMNSYVNECSDKFEHIKDVIKIMSKFVKDGEVERKKFGEVMTPLELVKEMLNTLPKEVWSNPDLKWLDPANGAGTFPYVVIYKLMKGLSEWEPDTEKRYKHIVENMIYTCELQSRNVFLWLCGVDPKNEYTTNSYWGSFLDNDFEYHMKNVWCIEKFDVVIGNPPYNENNSNSNEKIYFKFINKSYLFLKKNGFLCYVLPDDSISYIVNIEKYQICYINTNDIVNRYFKGVGTKILYFLSKKEEPSENTIFVDNKSNIDVDITKLSIILMNMDDTLLVDKINKYSDLKFSYNNAKFNNKNYRIRFNGIGKTVFSLRGINFICVDNKLLKKHNIFSEDFDRNIFKYKVIDHSSDRIEFYADKNFDNDFKRVCINTIGEIKPIYDPNGEYLLTDSFVYYKVDDDESANNLIDIINSNLSKYLQVVLTHNTKNKCKILNYLPTLDLKQKWNDNKIYEEFKLNTDEIKLIESTIKKI